MKDKYRKYDRFVLSVEEIGKLMDWSNEVFPSLSVWEQISINVSIPAFVVESDDGVYYSFVHSGNDLILHCGNTYEDHFEYRIVTTPDKRIGFIPIHINQNWFQFATVDEGVNAEAYQTYLKEILLIYAILNRLSVERPELLTYGEKNVVVPKTIKKNGKFKEIRTTKMIRIIRLNGEELAKRHNIITCPCWGVAGHYRHYKNGKTVFIKSYRKGKKRNDPEAYKPKTYELPGATP